MNYQDATLRDHREKMEKLALQISELASPAKQFDGVTFEQIDAVCDVHGLFQQRIRKAQLLSKIVESKSSCPACLEMRMKDMQQQEQEMISRRRQSEIDRLMGDLNLPERFTGSSLDNYDTVTAEAARCLKLCKAYAAKWAERRKQGGGLVMCGQPGTGKNHLALAIAKHVITEHQHSALFTTALRISRAFKSTWGKSAERTEYDVIHAYTAPDLLIIDEVGVQFGSESEKLILFEVINTRYEQMKPTILISNLTLEELTAFVGERVIDRMNDGGGCTLAFTWDSYRGRS